MGRLTIVGPGEICGRAPPVAGPGAGALLIRNCICYSSLNLAYGCREIVLGFQE